MFATLLSNLQTLISTRFLVANFFPTLAFCFCNALMLFWADAPFREYVQSTGGEATGLTAIVAAAVLVAMAFLAYAEAALLPAIQSLMEGNWPWPFAWLAPLLAPAQVIRLEAINGEIAANLERRGKLEATVVASGLPQTDDWRKKLLDARIAGCKTAGNNYFLHTESAKLVAKLAIVRRHSRPILAADLDAAVNALIPELRANNADLPGAHGDKALERTRQLLWDLIDYATQYADAQYRSLVTRREFHFGELPLSPTRMGNVARTVQSYAVERYQFNFELFWSRLQFLAQKDKDFGPLLQAAKTQLDFLISCSFLTLLWSAIWAVMMWLSSGPSWMFPVIALLGPVISYIWYRIAVAQYSTLADLLRTAIDLFRFDLLTALHHPLPDTVDAERELWQTLDRLHALYEIHPMRYVLPKSTS
jgi:hypothetical protein